MTFTFAAASGTSAALAPSVPASTTFLTGSYRTGDATDEPDGGADRLELTGCAGSPSMCTSITAQSYNGTSSVTVTAFAITFASGIRVQRGTLSYGAAATQATATLASPVNTGGSMAWNVCGSGPGVMKSDVGTASLPATAYQRVKLINPRTVQADRGVTDDIAEGSFEVVEWQLSPATPLMLIRSGTYTGNGVDNRPISVGFPPDVVIVDREDLTTPNPNDEAVIRTSTMLGDLSKNMDVNAGGTVLGANRVQSLDPMGFTVGTDNNVNQNGIVYHWVAFKAGSGQLKVGTYAGTGVAQNIPGVGFGPAYLMVVSAGAHNVVEKSVYMPANFSEDFIALGYTDAILDVQTDGFRVGTNAIANNNGTTYHYVAWAPVAGRVAVGSYTGTGADNRNITGTGFWPEWVVVSRASNVAGSQTNPPVHKPASTGVGADWALLFDGTLAENNNIQNLQADGFQIGNHARVNNAGAPNTYYWAAFGPHVPQVRYRSIGTAADLTNQGTITVTAGSTIVTKVGGTGWKTANRGRGDRLSVGTDHYLIASVDSDTALTLTAPAVTSYTGSTYTIARLFATLQSWEDCVSRSAINTCKRPADTQEYFPTASSSLVADDRSEVGIAYKDSVFTTAAATERDHRRLHHRRHSHDHAHRRPRQPALRDRRRRRDRRRGHRHGLGGPDPRRFRDRGVARDPGRRLGLRRGRVAEHRRRQQGCRPLPAHPQPE